MKNYKDIIVTLLLVLCFAGLLSYNIITFELFGRAAIERMERHAVLEAEQQEKIAARQTVLEFIELRSLAKIQDAADIIKFDAVYVEIKRDYLSSIGSISEEFEQKVANIDNIKILTNERIKIAEKFKQELEAISIIPEPLNDFYSSLIEFADNDIYTWKEILIYYSKNLSIDNVQLNGDDKIKEIYMRNQELYREVEELHIEIYSKYGLGSLL
jgi:hypothetical protein